MTVRGGGKVAMAQKEEKIRLLRTRSQKRDGEEEEQEEGKVNRLD